jgi:hypothetical protein
MDAPAILGILGFCLSLGLGLLEYRRYHLPLQLRLREVDLMAVSGDIYLVLLRVAFVNPALRGRTVYQLRLQPQGDAKVWRPPPQYREDRSSISYAIASVGGQSQTVVLPKSEILQLPLDIPPHQSRTGWVALVVQPGTLQAPQHFPCFDAALIAQDVSLRNVARISEQIELRTYTLHLD